MYKHHSLLPLLALLVAGAPALVPTQASAVSVSLELALVVDESGSVNTAEWQLQRDGYVQAFKNTTIRDAIIASGGIAVTYIQFDAAPKVGLGWTLLNDAASINMFADAIAALARNGDAGTGVAGAIRLAASTFGTEVGLDGNGFESKRQIIDVSGDGRENQSGPDNNTITKTYGDAAIAAGIDRINGVVISPLGEAGLLEFYQTQVQNGPDSFTVVANDFDDFAATVNNKIFREVTGTVPEGGSAVLMGLLAIGSIAGLRTQWRRNRQ